MMVIMMSMMPMMSMMSMMSMMFSPYFNNLWRSSIRIANNFDDFVSFPPMMSSVVYFNNLRWSSVAEYFNIFLLMMVVSVIPYFYNLRRRQRLGKVLRSTLWWVRCIVILRRIGRWRVVLRRVGVGWAVLGRVLGWVGLRRVDLRRVVLWRVDLLRVALRRVVLRRIALWRIFLGRVVLRRVVLRRVVLWRVVLWRVVLRRVVLRREVLLRSILRRIVLLRIGGISRILRGASWRRVFIRWKCRGAWW